MPPVRIAFYFDFISPYAWLALMQAREFARSHDVAWDPKPVVYAKLLDATGLVGPAETEAKRRYTFLDIARCAHILRLPVVGPPAHPFRSLEALRTTVLFLSRPNCLDLAVALADAAWGQGRDLTDLQVITDVVTATGLDASDLGERVRTPGVKSELARLTAEAIEAGVFGVPTFRLGSELFWGHDRLPQLAARLSGDIPSLQAAVEETFERPRGADRARIRERS